MLIDSVKLMKDDRVGIAYSKPSGDLMIDSQLKCPERATPEFYIALRKLEQVVKDICELDTDKKVSVTGVTYTYIGENQIMGAKIHTKLQIITGETIDITTPFRYSEHPTNATPDSKVMEHKIEEIFVAVSEACKGYIAGKREQTKMDLDQEEATDTPE